MNAKNTYAANLQENQLVDDIFLLSDAKKAVAKNGPFWNLVFEDKTGSLPAKIWSPESAAYTDLEKGQFWHIQGKVGSYNGSLQITIQSMQIAAQESLDLADFLPTSDPPPPRLLDQLELLLRTELFYPPWKKFCKSVLADSKIRSALLGGIGGKSIHHAYIGGLLEHTLSVCRVSLALASVYPQADKDILLTAAAFHDIGKAFELSGGIVRDYTTEGRLLGHIYMGLEILVPFLNKTKDLSEELKMHFKHLLLSHHGEFEFGSPKRPKTLEAFLLHYADNIDAKVNSMDIALAEQKDGEWSEYQRPLGRMLYKREKTPQPQIEKKPVHKEIAQPLLPF